MFDQNTDQSTSGDDVRVGFVVAWSSNAQDGSSYGVYAQRYNNDGSANGSMIATPAGLAT